MKSICFYFQVHQPIRLRKYQFFNIGRDHHYLDADANSSIIQKIARKCYLPMNALLLKLIKQNNGAFRVSFSMSGLAVEQFREFTPELLDSFRELAATGCVEFLGETYSHSLASLVSEDEFAEQVKAHSKMIKNEFGLIPKAFRNTELIYSDAIASAVSGLGFKTILAEESGYGMERRSPNYVYSANTPQPLKLLMRNNRLSRDVSFRFSDRNWNEWPLTAEKYAGWLLSDTGNVVNLFMDYEAFGERQKADSGIFEFIKHLPSTALKTGNLKFTTASETAELHNSAAVLSSPFHMSWADREQGVGAWLGNELQNEAFGKLYSLSDKVRRLDSPDYNHVWDLMQASDHFNHMADKKLSNGNVYNYFSSYDSCYDAFINYMNVLSDFGIELDRKLSENAGAKKNRNREFSAT